MEHWGQPESSEVLFCQKTEETTAHIKHWDTRSPQIKKSHEWCLSLTDWEGRRLNDRKRKDNDQGIGRLFVEFELSSQVQNISWLHDLCGHNCVVRRETLSLEEIKSRAFLRDWLDERKKKSSHKMV